jgi:hypothetical protein
VALLLVAAAVAAIVLLVHADPSRTFPADHGVTSADGEWVRCAVETIEHHPESFAAQNGFEIEKSGEGRLVVRSALLTTEIRGVDQSLTYWRFRGWHALSLDCPAIQPGEG